MFVPMHYILGIVMRDSDVEVLEDESPEKGNFMGLHSRMPVAEKMLKENPKIKQINFYKMVQGQRILAHSMRSELVG